MSPTSLEEVARPARMTRGAIYGNFAHREELFVAVGQARLARARLGAALATLSSTAASVSMAIRRSGTPLVRNGRDLALRRYGSDRLVGDIDRLYSDLLGRRTS